MCSKSAHKRRVSLTARLAVIYAGTITLLLLLSSALLYAMLIRTLAYEDRHVLQDKVHYVVNMLTHDADAITDLQEEVAFLAQHQMFDRFYLRVTDAHGVAVVESPHLTDLLPVASQPQQDDILTTMRAPDGKDFIAMTTTTMTAASGEPWHILVALYEDENTLLARYRRNMIPVLGCGIAVAILCSVLVTYRGLRPLATMAHEIGTITPQQLGARLRTDGLPAELTAVAQAFNTMLTRVENSFQQLSQFSDDLAHELRIPIQNLRSAAEVMLTQPRTPEEYRQALTSNLEESTRIARIIDSLLFLARVDNADTPLTVESLDAATEIQRVIDFYDALIEEKQIVVTCRGNAHLHADPILLSRVVANLLTNAITSISTGGRIDIDIAGDSVPVCLRFHDTGCGIAAQHLDRIFDRFYRVDPARANSQGMGLGLSIVKSIMALHGGMIAVSSRIGEGTTVTITFPS